MDSPSGSVRSMERTSCDERHNDRRSTSMRTYTANDVAVSTTEKRHKQWNIFIYSSMDASRLLCLVHPTHLLDVTEAGTSHSKMHPHATSSIFYEHQHQQCTRIVYLCYLESWRRRGRFKSVLHRCIIFERRKQYTYYSTLDGQQCTTHWRFNSKQSLHSRQSIRGSCKPIAGDADRNVTKFKPYYNSLSPCWMRNTTQTPLLSNLALGIKSSRRL